MFRKKWRVKYCGWHDKKFFFYSSALRFARKKYRAKITRIIKE